MLLPLAKLSCCVGHPIMIIFLLRIYIVLFVASQFVTVCDHSSLLTPHSSLVIHQSSVPSESDLTTKLMIPESQKGTETKSIINGIGAGRAPHYFYFAPAPAVPKVLNVSLT
jgi:hypothetical protein